MQPSPPHIALAHDTPGESIIKTQYTFSGLWQDLLPFAPLSRQKIVKLWNYCQRWVQNSGESVYHVGIQIIVNCELKFWNDPFLVGP